MAVYKPRIKLPTVLLIVFILLLLYYANEHWDIYPALHGAGQFAVVVIGVIIAFVIFDVVVGGAVWIASRIGKGIGGLFETKKSKKK